MIAIQSLSSKQGVFGRALCDVLRTRSTFRDGDSLLSCKGMICYYVDRAWNKCIFVHSEKWNKCIFLMQK